jgi:signal peptidase I
MAEINLLPKQTVAFEYYEDTTTKELGYGGAAGGGKTRLGWYIFIPAALKYPGSRWGIGRKELKTLRLTTLKTGFEVLEDLGLRKDKHYEYNQQDSVLRFSNGSEIFLIDTAYSPQDPNYTRFGGYELTGAWIDESNETPEKAKSILKTRVGRKNTGNNPDGITWTHKIWWMETFNPDRGHVYQDYYKPYRDNVMPDFRKFVPALPGDNPYLSQDYIDNLQRADKVTRERLLNGNFDYDDDPATMMSYDAISDLFTNHIAEKEERYITVDVARFGVDKTVIACWKGYHLYRLSHYDHTSIPDTIQYVKGIAAEERVPFSQIIADEDGIGGGVVDGLRGIRGFMGNRTPFPVIDTTSGKLVPANFQNLRAQCYHKLAEFVNNHRIKLTIEDRALQETIKEELAVVKRRNGDKDFQKFQIIGKNEIKELLGRSPDFADTIMMRMWFELSNPEKTETHLDPVQIILNKHRAARTRQSSGNDSLV